MHNARRPSLRLSSGAQGRLHFRVLLAVAVLALLIVGGFIYKRDEASGRGTAALKVAGKEKPVSEADVFGKYGGSQSCVGCHEEAFAAWKESNHALAERKSNAELDQQAFEPARSFRHGSQSSRVFCTNGTGAIEAPGLSSVAEAHAVARVIGNRPLRQFLLPFGGGRFQVGEAAYDPRSNGWFNVYGDEDRKPGEWGHWTGRGMTWNYMCAACHNTRLRRNYDAATDSYRTAMAEMSVGCESCHGPLKNHNDWQKQFGNSGRKDPTLPKFTRAQVLDYCGFCHARRTELTGDFKPGDRFLDCFHLAVVDHAEHYYPDGQIKDEDYEYGSFLGSRMHMRGVYCLDCHNPHSLKALLPGNWLCLRCHNGSDTNALVINPVAHSRHKVFGFGTNGEPQNFDLTAYMPGAMKETGGECVNCHMPQTVYMQRHWRHDHGFTSPDPLLTKRFGIPNACNRCHPDRDADWALKYCDEWYGTNMDRGPRKRAVIIAEGMRGDPQAREPLLGLLREDQAPYWQAVAAGLLSQWAANDTVAAALTHALEHTNALVRTAATTALEAAVLAGNARVAEALGQRLDDPVRSVRVAAAFALRASLAPDSPATRDLELYLETNADQPAGQMQEALYVFARNRPEEALEHLEKAVQWDPHSPAIRQELAVVLSALNRPRDALKTLEQACQISPNDAESQFRLGLACNEVGDLKSAVRHLSTAAKLNPHDARAWYNLGLAQNALGLVETAIESLSRAEIADPEDARIPYARATILARLGRTSEAKTALRHALVLDNSLFAAKQLLETLSN